MSIISGSSAAMEEIAGSNVAMPAMANSAPAVQAIAANPSAWPTFLASPYFGASDKTIMLNLVGATPSDYSSFDAVIADAEVLALIAANPEAVETFAGNSGAMTTLTGSTNIGIILGSDTAMGIIGTDTTAMTNFINTTSAMVPLLNSSAAKGFIVASTPLVDAVAANGAMVSYMVANGFQTIPASNRSGTTTVSQPFDGIPSKVMLLKMRANNIGAIAATYTFLGSPAAGTGASSTIALKGTVIETRVSGYTDLQWGVSGIAATAAASPEVTYFDMT